MTNRKLEELLNLPESKEIIDNATKPKKEKTVEMPSINDIADLDKISAALPFVKGLGESSDRELDELAQRATNAYDDLMDLGMNIEPRFSGRIFEVAGSMLKNAIDAKTAKIDKKLKMIELQLKKQKLDSETQNNETEINVEGCVITDRNSLLEKIKNMK